MGLERSASQRSLLESHPARLAFGNLALLATALAFVVVAIRALVVARLDPTTALALVQLSGPVNVFMGTLTTDLAEFLLAVLGIAVMLRLARAEVRRPKIGPFDLLLVLVTVIFFFTASWIFLVALVPVVPKVRPTPIGDLQPAWLRRIPLVFAGLLGAIGGGLFLFSTAVWLPQEELILDDGVRLRGYVLEEEGDWVSVLVDDKRELLLVKSGELESRRACASEDPPGPSLVHLIRELVAEAPPQPEYARCRE